MKKPNFFIIGAPKCGTTSLAAWLSEHPNVYMSPVKEPFFYSTDLNVNGRIADSNTFGKLFAGVREQHLAIGEASTLYLYSRVAVPHIEKDCPGAKYIVMVRNPVDMAYSLHDHYLFFGLENITDFQTAWRLSPERRKGVGVPPGVGEPKLLDYQSICCLGDRLERLFEVVQGDRVLVLVLDDIKANPRREYLKVLHFLGVPDDGRVDFPVYNPSKEYRWHAAKKFFLGIELIARSIKGPLGIPGGTGLLKPFVTPLKKLAIRHRPRAPMPKEFRQELLDYYREDILKLGRTIGRDLSAWLCAESDQGVKHE